MSTAAPVNRAVGQMLLASVIFAAMATCVALAQARDPGLSTFTASGVRSVVNLVVLAALSWRDPRALFGDLRPALWARGVLGGIALVTYFATIKLLSVGEAAFLNQTSAVWVALASPWLLGQTVGAPAWVAIAGSMLGMILLAHPRPGEADTLGRVLGMASGLSAAGAYVAVNKASGTNSAVTIVFWFTLVGSVASLVGMAVTHARPPVDVGTLAWLIGAGICATVAQLLMTAAYRDGHAASIAAASATGPLLTTLSGAVVLGQWPDGRASVGMGILLVCSMILPFWTARR